MTTADAVQLAVTPADEAAVAAAYPRVGDRLPEMAYAAWLGFYNSARGMGWDKPTLVQQANRFSRALRAGGVGVGEGMLQSVGVELYELCSVVAFPVLLELTLCVRRVRLSLVLCWLQAPSGCPSPRRS